MKNLNNSAFTLLEILLSAVIFVVSVAGIFATLSAVRAPVANKESGLSAAVFGKQVLEALRSQVSAKYDATNTYMPYYSCNSQNPCPDFSLSIGTHQVTSATLALAGLTWPTAVASKNTLCDPAGCLVYTVTCADGSASPCTNSDIAHKVDLSINW
jgi:Tfp pilus assembly protein PilV